MGRPCRAWAFWKASVRIGELSVRMVVPMPMKNLFNISPNIRLSQVHRGQSYPNVKEDPIMYCPSVLIMPFGPGP